MTGSVSGSVGPPAGDDPKPAWRSWARSLPPVPADVSVAVTRQLADFLAPLRGAVLAYLPLPDEVDIRDLLEPAVLATTVVLPRLDDQGGMTLHVDDGRRVRHRLGIEQPVADSARVSVDDVEAVVVPGQVFDAHGYRLGRGGGHYDRFLPAVGRDVPVIGVTTQARLVARLPREPHDRPMSHLVIETGVYPATSIQLRAAAGHAE